MQINAGCRLGKAIHNAHASAVFSSGYPKEGLHQPLPHKAAGLLNCAGIVNENLGISIAKIPCNRSSWWAPILSASSFSPNLAVLVTVTVTVIVNIIAKTNISVKHSWRCLRLRESVRVQGSELPGSYNQHKLTQESNHAQIRTAPGKHRET
jgi:hypothetical protein